MSVTPQSHRIGAESRRDWDRSETGIQTSGCGGPGAERNPSLFRSDSGSIFIGVRLAQSCPVPLL
jgi:hypothetical protein